MRRGAVTRIADVVLAELQGGLCLSKALPVVVLVDTFEVTEAVRRGAVTRIADVVLAELQGGLCLSKALPVLHYLDVG